MKQINELLKLADSLDQQNYFNEANIVDEFISKNRLKKKKLDSIIPLGYQPQNNYETIQKLQFI